MYTRGFEGKRAGAGNRGVDTGNLVRVVTEEDGDMTDFGMMMLGCDRFEVKEAVIGDVSCDFTKEDGRW